MTAVMGMLADKNVSGALELLVPHFQRIFCVTPDNPRALPAGALAGLAKGMGVPAQAFGSARDAYHAALEHAGREHGAVVVCGSLYLAGEMRSVILSDAQ